MKSAKEIATHVIERYGEITNSSFGTSELKLQKLMYFIQRQALALTGRPLFEEPFEGWLHGPVIPQLRYLLEYPSIKPLTPLTCEEKYIIDNVILEYGRFSAWELREFTHQEISWKKSRIGLSDDDYGTVTISLDDIREDAKKVRLYDHEYDMFVDEFDDFNEEVFT